MRPRVLVITPDFPPAKGGIQILTQRIVSAFTRFDPYVVTIGHADARDFDRGLAYPITRVRSLGGRRALTVPGLNAASALTGLRVQPQVVLCMHVVLSPAALALRLVRHIPYVQYVHAKELGVRRDLASLALRRADRVIAVSSYTRGLAERAGARPQRISLIHPGVESVREVSASESSRRDSSLLTISRLEDRYKGHDVMLRALPLIRSKVPSVTWRVVGDGPLRHTLEHRAHALGVSNNVTFLGSLDDHGRDDELARAEVFCMVSRLPAGGFAGEGFGIVYLEANAAGVAVIGGGVGGATDAVLDGVTGILVDPEDHVELAGAVIELLQNDRLRRDLVAAGLRRAAELTWDHAARQVESILAEVLG